MNAAELTALRRELSDQTGAALAAEFTALPDYRDRSVPRFIRRALPILRGGQRAMGQLVSAFLTESAGVAAGRTLAPVVIPSGAVTDLRRGVSTEQVYERPFVTVWTALAREIPFDDAVDRGVARLAGLAEFDMQAAYSAANDEGMDALPEDVRPDYWRRVLVGAENCAMCVLASTQRYRRGDLNPIHPGCVPGSVVVRARRVSVATRRWYSGELAVITTAAGDQVAVTPNHPVLTDEGWVRACEVRRRHHVVRSGDVQGVVGRGPNEDHEPSLAEDVWRALAVTFGVGSVPLSAEDFDGDGADGHVDVVRADSYFSAERNTQFLEMGRQLELVPGLGGWEQFACLRGPAPFVPRGRATAAGGVSLRDLTRALLGGHLCGAHATGVGRVAPVDARFPEPSGHGRAADPLNVRDDVLGNAARDVVGPELLVGVTDVGRVDFSGHVFNFQTDTGTYEADSHIVHNCDCRVEAIFPGDVDTLADLDTELVARAHAAARELTGTSDAGGRRVDYRTVTTNITAVHGEHAAPLLVRPLDRFTGPEAIPGDDDARRSATDRV